MTTELSKASLWAACLFIGITTVGAVARAQTFSADLIITKTGRTPNPQLGRIYVADGKVRIEAPGFADGFFIVDADSAVAWFVRPRQKLFMDAKQSSPLTRILVPVDPAAPCRLWQMMEDAARPTISETAGNRAAWRCDAAGRAVVGGREILKYVATSPENRRSYRWVDPQRGFTVRVENDDGTTIALENVVDEPQLASLFAIPPAYRKFDPRELINQIKLSDVWVEPPR